MNNEQNESGYPKIDLSELIHGTVRSLRHMMKKGIILMLLLAVLMCLRTYKNYTPMYEANASFTVRVTNPFYATQQYYNVAAAEQMAQTFPYILSSSVLSQQVMQALHINAMPDMNVSVLGNTNIISLAVRSSEPQLAYDVLHCVMDMYSSVAEFVIGPTTLTLMSESGVPQAPFNVQNYPRAAAKGILLGAAIWGIIALIYWLTHQTVSGEEALAKMVNLECMSKVPMVRGFNQKKSAYGCPMIRQGSDKFGFSESIRLLLLRTERKMVENNSQVLLVTSTIANEGKTTISVNLASAMAQNQKLVLLVDCDLRNPSVAKAMGKSGKYGLSEYLQGKCQLADIMDHKAGSSLYVVRGGKPVSRPEQLIGSKAMKKLIAAARSAFDYIILDTPPCALMADTTEMFALADCALLSVRQDFACRRQILEGIQILEENKKPILGYVMNMNESGVGSGSYYGYGYYGKYGRYGQYGDTGRSTPQHKTVK